MRQWTIYILAMLLLSVLGGSNMSYANSPSYSTPVPVSMSSQAFSNQIPPGTEILSDEETGADPQVPKEDPTELSLSQRFVQNMVAAGITGTVTYPINALLIDVQAGQPVNLKPNHLLRGIGSATARFAPVATSVFMTNHLLGGKDEDASFPYKLFAATIAGGVGAMVTNPFELVITKQRFRRTNAAAVRKKILEQRGFSGYYQGIDGMMFREIFYAWGLLLLPQMVTPMLPESFQDSDLSSFAVTTGAGMLTGAATLPFETARNRIQRQEMVRGKSDDNVMKILREIYSEEGTAGLFKALPYRIARFGVMFPAFAMTGNLTTDFFTSLNEKRIAREKKNRGDIDPEVARVQDQLIRSKIAKLRERNLALPTGNLRSPHESVIITAQLEELRNELADQAGLSDGQKRDLALREKMERLRRTRFGGIYHTHSEINYQNQTLIQLSQLKNANAERDMNSR